LEEAVPGRRGFSSKGGDFMTGQFEAFVPVTRVWKDNGGEMFFEGIASSMSVDKQNERMTERAIRKMSSFTGIDLLPSHNAGPLEELGVVTETWVDNDKLRVAGRLDPDNPQAMRFFRKVQSGKPYQLSVGGRVKSAFWRFEPALNKHIKHIDDVELDHVAVCRPGRAANPDTYLTVMAKSIELPTPEPFREPADGWIERLAKALARFLGAETGLVVGRKEVATETCDDRGGAAAGQDDVSTGKQATVEEDAMAEPVVSEPSAHEELAKDIDTLKTDVNAAIQALSARVEHLEKMRGVKQSLDGQDTESKVTSLWRGVV